MGHDPIVLTKAAKLTVDGRPVPGVLTVTKTKFTWDPNDPTAAQPMTVLLSTITGRQKVKGKPFMKILTGTTHLVLELDNEQDRDTTVDVLGSGVAPQQAAPTASNDKNLPPSDVRKRLLQENKDVAHLYTSLVRPGIISEEEFWRSRRVELEAAVRTMHTASTSAPAVNGVRPGLPNAMPSLGESADGRTNKVLFSVTPEVIAQIFASKPAVEKAFRANVPANMSSEEFWGRYYKHQLALKKRRHLLMLGKSADNVADEHREMFEEQEDRAAAGAARAKVRRVDPALNLAADEYDGFAEGFGAAHDPARDHRKGPSLGEDIVRDVNRHADVVLRGLPASSGGGDPAAFALRLAEQRKADQAAQATQADISEEELAELSRRRGRTLDDLTDAPQERWSELHLSDPRRYFDQVVQDASNVAQRVDSRTALQRLQSVRPDAIPLPVMSTTDAYEVLLDLSKGAATGHEVDSSGQPTRSPAVVLSAEELAVHRGTMLTANELLRHFWSCFPVTTPARTVKVEKLKAALASTYDKIQETLRAAQGTERGRHVAQLLRPAEVALNTAFIKYDQDVAGKGAGGRWAAAS